MTPSRPYLIRAIHDWLSDNGMTPQLLVDTSVAGCVVPAQFVSDNRILLNISMSATHGLDLGNEQISFSARFGGAPFQVRLPVRAVLAIYARENGQGMMFQDEPAGDIAESRQTPDASKKPVLTVIK